ncbi:RNA polymerase sigma factor [Leptothrix ochracea]|uniref:RNA polymerase sigma factor n=1 Tax=Leptothrix ochracea TaxID=735331 RepID=UPI0034E2F85E
MDATLSSQPTLLVMPMALADKEQRLTATLSQERGRLRSFIRGQVRDVSDAEDILQDVFFEFTQAWRLPEPIEQAGAWLFRVARHRIIDRFRKKREEPLRSATSNTEASDTSDADEPWLEDVLPSPEDGPEALYARKVLLEHISAALAELPEEQRAVFIAHEIEGRSFEAMAQEQGLSTNTLLARKRYAVLALRKRLQPIHDAFFE